ncbi:hypothetical protein AB0H83_06410 [Dactylosporangium sp. NPDC050688]|uniref:PilN domain-containing protein n=1 Tax=Dactylosporangium sp. NPDC050688 TaxID=3157217 RepID=UPI0033FB9CA4
MSGTWWEDEPERKLTGIVLPSWDNDPDDGPDDGRGDGPDDGRGDGPDDRPNDGGRGPGPSAQPLGRHQPAPPTGERPADPLTDPLDGGWWQEPAAARPERLVPVVPSGPPPVWPPTTPEAAVPEGTGAVAADPFPQARVDLRPLTAAAPEAALVPQAAEAAAPQRAFPPPAAEMAAPRRAFPKYIAGELVLPGTAEPAATPDTRTRPVETGHQPAGALTRPAETWAPQPTSQQFPQPTSQSASQPEAGPYAAPPPRPAPPVTQPPSITQPPEEADATHPRAKQAGERPADAVTAVQPAVPAVVHAAQQGAPGTGQEGQAPPVPAKKHREGAPHPAFPDATARTMRILPIAADLLPLEITELRRLRMVRRLVIAGVAMCVALLLGWYVVADGQTDEAQSELTAVQDLRRDLNRKKATYTQLESTRQQIKDITTQLGILMERDMSWSALLGSLRKAAPRNVTVANVTGSLDLDDTTGTTGTADTSGDVVGMLTLSGTAPSKDEVASYVDTLGTVPGLANPFPSEATQDDSGLHFTIRVDITKAALGGRFTSPGAAPSASGGK